MESLGIDFRLIVIQLINFGLLLFLLTKFLYRPILKILDERRRKIAESLAAAQKIEEERVKLEEKKKEELNRAKEAGQTLLVQMRQEAEKQKEAIIGRARQEAEHIAKKARRELDLEKEKLREELRKELGDLVVVAAERLIGQRLVGEERGKLLSHSLKNLREEALATSSVQKQFPVFGAKKVSPQALKIAEELVLLLKKTRNLYLLPEILQKLSEVHASTRAEVTTASSLESAEQKRMLVTLREIFGQGISVEFRVEPKILGGMVVKVGDRVFDASLLGKASQLKELI